MERVFIPPMIEAFAQGDTALKALKALKALGVDHDGRLDDNGPGDTKPPAPPKGKENKEVYLVGTTLCAALARSSRATLQKQAPPS